MKSIRRLRKSIKAISPVLAVLMMIAVAIAGSLITYAWITGYIGFTTDKAGKAIMIQSVANAGDDLLVYVQNVGEGVVELNETSCLYLNGALTPCAIDPADGLIGEGDTATLTVAGGAAGAGEKVTAKVTTLLGTFTEKSTYPESTTGGPPTPQWLYRKPITIQHSQVTGPLTNFPVLISLPNDPDLATDALENGDDIKFVADDETTQLAHEIEKFDGTTGELIAWVKIPSLSATADTVIYMYYGNDEATNQQNPTAVWDTNYKAVWHLKEAGTGTADEYKDSTGAHDGQGGSGQVPTLTSSGRINGAQDFSNDYINVGGETTLKIQTTITLEAWVKIDSTPGWCMIIARQDDGGSNDAYLIAISNDNKALMLVKGGSVYSGTLAMDTWYHLVGVAGPSGIIIYVNGAPAGSTSGISSWTIDDNPVFIGAGENPGPSEYFDGIIDEARISNTVRSSDWIQTEYNNMNAPSSFINVGSEESL